MTRAFALCLLAALLCSACEETLVEPEFFGSLAGQVVDAETGAPIAGASVSTSPPSSAIITSADGAFRIESLMVGNYSITATKPGYESGGISVAVREDETTSASLPLRAIPDEEPTPASDLRAEVLNWVNTASGDSNFVEVQYRVENGGPGVTRAYEVYLEISTTGLTFYDEVRGDTLRSGQADIGGIVRYTYTHTATDVQVSGVWFEDETGLWRPGTTGASTEG